MKSLLKILILLIASANLLLNRGLHTIGLHSLGNSVGRITKRMTRWALEKS